jgi:hypothetical protein
MHILTVRKRADLAYIPARITALDLCLDMHDAVHVEDITSLPEGLRVLCLRAITHDALYALVKLQTELERLELYVDHLDHHALDALAALSKLAHVSLHSAGKELPSLASLTKLTSLTSLTLTGVRRLSHAELAALTELPKLTSLELSNIASREQDALVTLKDCASLTSLLIRKMAALSSREVAAINALPHLTTATLTADTLDDLRVLEPLDARLHALHLRPGLSTPHSIDDDFWRALITRLPRIRSLQLMGLHTTRHYTANGLAALAKLDRLAWLNMKSLPTHITPNDLTWLTQLPELRRLDLKGEGIGPKIADILKDCDGLTTMTLHDIKMSDAAVKKLTALQQLEGLALRGAPLTDKGFVELGKLKNLRNLFLFTDKGQLGDVGLQALGNLPELRELTLELWSSSSAYTGTTLAPLATLANLELLEVHTRTPDFIDHPNGLRTLAGAPSLQQIQLGIFNGGAIGPESAAALRTIPTLRFVGYVTGGAELFKGHALATDEYGVHPTLHLGPI